MLQTIFAAFTDAKDAERAAGALMDHGLTANDISFVAHESYRDGPVGEDRPKAMYTPGPDGGIASGTGVAATGLTQPVIDAEDIQGDPAEAVEGAVHPNRLGDTTYSAMRPFSIPGSEASANAIWAPGDESFEATSAHEERDGSPRPLISTTTGQDVASGAGKGAVAGLGVGLIAGLTSLFLPGFGWVLGGGGLSLALAGAAATTAAGAAAGGVTGFLKDQGVPEDVLIRYHDAFEHGGAILGVLPTEAVDRPTIEAILAKYGALNIDTYGEERMAG